MNTFTPSLLIVFSLLFGTISLHAQGTAFTYQGRLDSDGGAANGSFDFRFRLASDALGSNYVVSPLLTDAVPVSNGLFTVILDFGAGIFTGSNFWLQVDVKTNGAASYTALTPLQAITPTPYAITASNLSGTLPATQLSGTVASANLAGTYSNALTLNNATNSFSGNGAELTALNASELTSGTVADTRLAANVARTHQVWLLGGNAGTSPGPHFLGTTDDRPMELSVNGMRALRLEPTVNDASHSNMVNVVGGASGNLVGVGVYGATIGGGGALSLFGVPYINRVEANLGTVSGGGQNTIQSSADCGTIGGGVFNTIETAAAFAALGGGYRNIIETNASFSTLTGGRQNTIQSIAFYGTISGGVGNMIQTDTEFGTISGGYQNTIQTNADAATIGGGGGNTIQHSAPHATIGGGVNNTIQSNAAFATIGGGYANTIQPNASGNDSYATIPGGGLNTIQFNAFQATIGGGFLNTIYPEAQRGTIGGGLFNTIQSNAAAATIGGGTTNEIQPNAANSTIGGGRGNTIQRSANSATIAGGNLNLIQTLAGYTSIGGGLLNRIQTNAINSAIAGGYGNTIGPNAFFASIGGGQLNTIQLGASHAAISGGHQNTIQTNAEYTCIGGGYFNTIQTNASYTTLGGGYFNTIQPNATHATLGGGYFNTIQLDAAAATIGGGSANAIETNAFEGTIGGGAFNTIGRNASYATIAGGRQNTIQPNAGHATIPGGAFNSAASYAFAAGYRAKANHAGAFVWADSQDADLASTANNQFCIRASGGVHLTSGTSVSFGSTLSQKINLYGTTFGLGIQSSVQYSRVGLGSGYAWYAGGVHNDNTFNSGGGTTLMTLTGGGLTVNGILASSSDRNVKENFATLQPREILEKLVALPLSSWNYKADTATRHIGPMAQDFYAAFNVGADDKHIATVDADGVAFAAIQGLNQKVEEKDARIGVLEKELSELKLAVKELRERKQ
jgi:trimeric autotransporter adhesin